MTTRKIRAEFVLSHFRRCDEKMRFEVIRRKVETLESVIIGLENQIDHVKQLRIELAEMITIIAEENSK